MVVEIVARISKRLKWGFVQEEGTGLVLCGVGEALALRDTAVTLTLLHRPHQLPLLPHPICLHIRVILHCKIASQCFFVIICQK